MFFSPGPESIPSSTASGAQRLAQNADPALPVATETRLHLPYLDGLRALMALYVMHQHLLGNLRVRAAQFEMPFSEIIQMFRLGHYAVVVFIVLSGYCLMLPVLRDGGMLRGGMKAFFTRRARRILPPYYGALAVAAISLAIIAVVQRLPFRELASPESWVLHLLLLHNLSSEHVGDFNGALWSIATEWQIYFLFPFLLLPVWRRFNEGGLLLVAAGVSGGIVFLFPSIARACPWFIALFALGMVAARMSLEPAAWVKRVPWGWMGLLLLMATYLLMRTVPAFQWRQIYALKEQYGWYPLSDVAFGCVTFCFLLHGTRATLEERRSKFVQALTWKPLIFIGAFSYSLYLIHMPMLSLSVRLLASLHLARSQVYGVMLLIGLPLIIALAYGFYLVFEKPFLRSVKPAKVRPTTSSA